MTKAAFYKAKLKDKKLQKVEFLRVLPAYLEHEALLVWRKKQHELLKPPADGSSD